MSIEDIAAVTALLDQAKRLGLIPTYRYGTVLSTSGSASILMVTLDGDDQPSRTFNLVGGLAAGARVLTMGIAPHGVYTMGVASARPMEQSRNYAAMTGAAVNLTTSVATLAGTSITVTGIPAGAYYKGEVFADFQTIGSTTTTGVVQMFIDGVAASAQNALMSGGPTTGVRATAGQNFTNFSGSGNALLTAGTHVFDLRAFRSGGADTQIRVNATHTTLTLTIYF